MKDYEIIEKQNEKSKEIMNEYEKIAQEKRENKKKEEDVLILLIKAKENEIYLLKEEDNKLRNKNNYTQIDEIDEKIENLKAEINDIKNKLHKVHSIDVYPHGNGIYGFALLFYDISLKILIEWKEPIYVWTVLGFKLVYPKHAFDYIQYKKDIKKSKFLMKVIENKVRMENKNIYELHENDWIYEINNYLNEKNIIIEDDFIFRPPMNNIFRNDDDDNIQYYRITKNDLNNIDDDDDDFDIFEYLLLNKKNNSNMNDDEKLK